ncbi:hypothetical protein K488DRAFT_72079 [Vararia minispora EC-137]|uniref:Uncharacterized protein n=1 Tax=Vararia minispora EC-137 TaxID=1314806 RepID=A0ACB8QFW5_9AGAM|nr:hypothetical protein K488DRAFT_72079 [Vararia minispora EC-137]
MLGGRVLIAVDPETRTLIDWSQWVGYRTISRRRSGHSTSLAPSNTGPTTDELPSHMTFSAVPLREGVKLPMVGTDVLLDRLPSRRQQELFGACHIGVPRALKQRETTELREKSKAASLIYVQERGHYDKLKWESCWIPGEACQPLRETRTRSCLSVEALHQSETTPAIVVIDGHDFGKQSGDKETGKLGASKATSPGHEALTALFASQHLGGLPVGLLHKWRHVRRSSEWQCGNGHVLIWLRGIPALQRTSPSDDCRSDVRCVGWLGQTLGGIPFAAESQSRPDRGSKRRRVQASREAQAGYRREDELGRYHELNWKGAGAVEMGDGDLVGRSADNRRGGGKGEPKAVALGTRARRGLPARVLAGRGRTEKWLKKAIVLEDSRAESGGDGG